MFEDQSINANEWYWSFGDSTFSTAQNPAHTYYQEGEFYVQLIVENEFCIDTAWASIQLEEELIFYVPNAFTPDGDDLNNVFLPIFTSGFNTFSYHLSIYNRWGELIFESYDINLGWDGTYKGKNVQTGVYTWGIEFDDINNLEHRYTGHVVLLK